VGTGLLYLATDVCKIHYLLSTLLCSLLTNALGFCLNRRLAFRARSAHFWRELGRYYIVNLGSLALSLTLMALCVSGLGWPYLGASIGLSLLLAVGNFFLHRNWSFGT
jgi:putative flippase GtrA